MSMPTPAQTPDQILRRLDWTVVRRLDGLLQGNYRTLFRGYGLDFADLREYQPSDDLRAIDWNVTARMDTPYVREYLEDREITAWFLLDLSPSMDYGTVQRAKRQVLIELVTTLARLLTRSGNRVGAICYGAGVGQTIPARGGRLHLLRLVNDLLRQPQLPRAPQTALAPLMTAGLRQLKRRSLVIVVSDFLSAPGWEQPLRQLRSRHDVVAVRLWDRREVELPDVGPIWLEDAETGEQLYVDTRDRGFRARFHAAAQQRELALTDAFRSAGVDTLTLATDEDLVRALVRFAARRSQRRAPVGQAAGAPGG